MNNEDIRNYLNQFKIDNLQFDLNGNFIREWKSATKASKKLKLFQGNISACCLNKVHTCGGFKWTFKNIRYKYKTTKV